MGVFTNPNDAPSASSRVTNPSRPDNYLSLHRVSAPRLRRHTTPLQSVVRSPHRTSLTIAERPHEKKACCVVVGRAVSHPQNAYSAHLRGQYQQPHPVRKASTITFSLIAPEAPPIRLYRPSRRCHGFCRREAQTLPPRCWSVMPPVRVLVLVPAGEHSACRQHRPAAARRPASTSQSP